VSKKLIELILAAVVVAGTWIAPLRAQPYPNKVVKVIVVYPAGAVADVMLRIVAERLTALLGQPFILDNRPGGSGISGTLTVAKASPDGYTLLMTGVNHVTNTGLFANLPYDSLRDFTPVGVIGTVPVVLVAHPSTGFKTVQDLIRAAKARPGEINFASSGNGTAGHMATEMFAQAAGIKLTHVPYRGGPQAVTDTVGGQIQINSLALSLAMPFIKDGRLIPLLQAGTHKNKALPNVPTMDEIGMRNFIIEVWFGLLAPANLDQEAQRVLKTTLTRIMREPDVIARLDAQSIIAASADPADMAQMLNQQMQQLPRVLQELGIKPE
jgi:tripartite-type tricarboxylate transporter receptor subunit TctC